MSRTRSWILGIVLLSLAGLLAGDTPAPGADRDPLPGSRTAVVLLGTGTPNTDPDAHGPALAVVVGEQAYLVDCGPGVVRRAAAAYLAGVEALDTMRLDRLFVTHLHSDHTAGYPDLVLSPWVMGRDRPLQVVGPAGMRSMTEHLHEAYREDIRNRIDGPEPANTEGYKVEVTEIAEPGEVYRDELVAVQAFPAQHGSWEHAFGYRFVTPDLDVCISGDTAPYPEMPEHYEGCDILVHEVYAEAGFAGRPDDWQAYHRASHTSGIELGAVAGEVAPGLLVLTHVLLWEAGPLDLLDEISTQYHGQVVLGADLTYLSVSPGFVPARDGERQGSFVVLPLR